LGKGVWVVGVVVEVLEGTGEAEARVRRARRAVVVDASILSVEVEVEEFGCFLSLTVEEATR
jgi:hypothetical protein